MQFNFFIIASLLMFVAAALFLIAGITQSAISLTVCSVLFIVVAIVFARVGKHKALQT